MINTVQELINELMKVEDKTKPIFIYHEDLGECQGEDFSPIISVDHDLSDRVDLNLPL